MESILDLSLFCSSKDFVMNVGGSVWALDWCPRDHEKFDCPVKFEVFIFLFFFVIF